MFEWFDGGNKVIAVKNGDNFTSTVTLFDCRTGMKILGWTLPHWSLGPITVSSDNKNILLLSSGVGVGPSECIDLSIPANSVIRRTFPTYFALVESAPAKFFADGRRVLVSSGWRTEPIIVDVVNGTHLANLPLPAPKSGNRDNDLPTVGLLISADGQHVAAQLRDGQMQVYDHVGIESRWGIMNSPWFGAMAVILSMVVYSLWRDACKQAKMIGPCRAAAGLVVASVPPLILLCGSIGLRQSSGEVLDQFPGWQIILAAFSASGLVHSRRKQRMESVCGDPAFRRRKRHPRSHSCPINCGHAVICF